MYYLNSGKRMRSVEVKKCSFICFHHFSINLEIQLYTVFTYRKKRSQTKSVFDCLPWGYRASLFSSAPATKDLLFIYFSALVVFDGLSIRRWEAFWRPIEALDVNNAFIRHRLKHFWTYDLCIAESDSMVLFFARLRGLLFLDTHGKMFFTTKKANVKSCDSLAQELRINSRFISSWINLTHVHTNRENVSTGYALRLLRTEYCGQPSMTWTT